MTKSKTAKRVGIVLLSAAALSAVGVAFAAWTSDGLGSGTAQSTTDAPSTIAAATSAADLYPGALKSVTVTVNNPNDYPVIVTQISDGTSDAVGGCVAGSVFSKGLGAANSSTAVAQDAGAGTVIAPGATGTYRIETRMIGDAADACKSKTFNLPLTAELLSAAVTAP